MRAACPGGGSLAQRRMRQTCQYKYDMIVDNPESSFWQVAYNCAQEWAQKNDAILELKGNGKRE